MRGTVLYWAVDLDNTSQDLESFINGELILFNDISVKKDKVYESLIQPSEVNGSVILPLSVISQEVSWKI